MPYILSIETATKVSSVALHCDGNLISEQENLIEQSHAESLTRAIQDVLQTGGIKIGDLNAVAVSKGPGSYTGLRIGVSVAKGLCYGMNIPLIGIDTLKSMALEVSQVHAVDSYLCPMIDARRMEVYCQIFNHRLQALNRIEALIIKEDSFNEWISENKLLFFGDGAAKCVDTLKHQQMSFVENVYPKAKYIGELAWGSFQRGQFENLAYFEPYYLKEFVAKEPSGKNLV